MLLLLPRLFTIPPFVALALVSAAPDSSTLQVDQAAGQVSFDARVARQGVYEQLKGVIEYIACCRGGKEYETLFVSDADPLALREALVSIGLEPGSPARQEGGHESLPRGPPIRIFVSWKQDGRTRQSAVEDFITDTATGKAMTPVEWAFTGSQPARHPETGEMTFKAVLTRNLISLHHLDPSVLVQNPLEAGRDDGRYQARLESLPAEGTPITLILRIPRREEAGSIAPGERRIHWVVRGRVQGVGFRAFTQRTALILDLRGWVRNLPSGEVELVAQGPEGALKEFEEKITRGPRGSKVEHIEALETAAEEKLGEFTIRPSSE